jgi:DNA mismatch repair protein MLH3
MDRASLRRVQLNSDETRPPAWLANALDGWVNPVFPSAGPALRSIGHHHHHHLVPQNPDAQPRQSSSLNMRDLGHFFSPTGTTPLPTSLAAALAGHPINRTSLSRAQFLAQLDRKFIVCRLPLLDASESSVLVVVDQHAAHERVRVESFLSAVCDQAAEGAVESRKLVRPSLVSLTKTEAQALQAPGVVEEFKRWGVVLSSPKLAPPERLQIQTQTGGSSSSLDQAEVTEVPAVVADRLEAEPKTLADLVKQHIARLLDDGGVATNRTTADRRSVTAKDCPGVLLALLDSKACRGSYSPLIPACPRVHF